MRLLSLATGLGIAMATVAAPASAALGHPASGRHPVPGARLTLAQAPAALRAAVGRTLGHRELAHSSFFQQKKLPAPSGATEFGFSVAISGTTAVMGSPESNMAPGVAYVFVRSGATWSEQAALTASDGGENDSFGWSVAVSGSTVVVGAWGKNEGAGAAYVFTRSGTTWSQRAELTAADAVPGDSFGRVVAISGSTAVIGAYDKNSSRGAAYVFARSGRTWSQQAELTATGGAEGDGFGASVAVDGSTAVIGATQGSTAMGTGEAFVFTRSGTTWSQQAKLTPPDGVAGDYFGGGVAISGSTAVIGAPGENSNTGAAFVFARSGTAWSQQGELTAAGNTALGEFGFTVGLSGSTAVVGGVYQNTTRGAVYVFAGSGPTWFQEAELTAADGGTNDSFGVSLAISGPHLVVGAYAENSFTGGVYSFVLPWQQAELTATGGAPGDGAGNSVAFSGSIAVVGAPDRNAAYVFARSGSTWSQQAELDDPVDLGGDYFGGSVAVSGSTVAVGALGMNGFTGAVYVFARSGTAWPLQTVLTAPAGAAGDEFGVSVAASGSIVLVGAWGQNSFRGAAYVFVQSRGVWSQQAELTAVDGSAHDNFGNAVALSGLTAVVGADGRNSGTGAVYVFSHFGRTWTPESELTAPGGSPYDSLGTSVAVAGGTVVAGAPGRNSGTGAAYVFTADYPGWSFHAGLTASDAAAGDAFGISVAVSGPAAVVGADGRYYGTGTAYLFTRSSNVWSQQAELGGAQDPRSSYFGSSAALSGTTAVIGAPAANSDAGAASVFGNL